MSNLKSKQKRHSAQISRYSSHNDSLILANTELQSPQLSHQVSNEFLNDQRPDHKINKKPSEFESLMKTIQDSDSARRTKEEINKALIRKQLRQKIIEFSENKTKESSSTDGGSNPVVSFDSSLVNFESIDGNEDEITGNSEIISAILEQSCLISSDKKYNKRLIQKMVETIWTDWFVIGFSSWVDGIGLYGRSSGCLVKIDGKNEFPEKIEFPQITRSFKYDWVNRRFKHSESPWDSDAIVYKDN